MNTPLSYSEIIQDAARIFWKQKQLWVLGMLTALFGQGGANTNLRYEVQQPLNVGPAQMSRPMINLFLGDNWQPLIPLFVALAVVATAWAILGFILSAWVQGAQINMVVDVVNGAPTGIKSALGRAWQRIGALIGLSLVAVLPALIMLAIILAAVAPVFTLAFFRPLRDLGQMTESSLSGLFAPLLCAIPLLLCIGVPSLIVLGLLLVFAQRACMVEGLGVGAAYRRAARLVRRHLGYTLLTGIILLVIGALFASLVALPAALLWLPVAEAFLGGAWTPIAIGAAFGLALLTLLVNIGLGGLLAAFGTTLWTRLYLDFVAREQPATFAPLAPAVSSDA